MQLTAGSVEYHAHTDAPYDVPPPAAQQPQPPQQWGDDWNRSRR
jgi:ABC-2 type transport system ATP-binding protein